MAVTLLPDVKGAFIAWARGQTDITTICPSANIKGVMPTAVDMPTFWLTCTKMGGLGSLPYLPLSLPRLDIWCFGPTAYEAFRLARTVRSCLIPVERAQGGIVGFESAGCRVIDVQDEASPREDATDQGWPYVWQPYIFRISEVPVS